MSVRQPYPVSSSSGGAMAIGGAITSATQGSVLFAGVGGILAQDNPNLFWDDTNNRLGIGNLAPSRTLHVTGSARFERASASPMLVVARITDLVQDWGLSVVTDGAFRIVDITGTKEPFSVEIGSADTSFYINNSGTADPSVGIGTILPNGAFEINHSTGNNLRLTYNDSTGSATNYSDFLMSSGGILTILPSGNALVLGGGTTATEIRFLEPSASGANYSAFKAKAQTANITYTLPDTIGGVGTFLKDAAGDGILSWATTSSSAALAVATKTGNYTLTGSDGLILADATSGSFTLTLPTAVGITGVQYYVKKIDSSVNTVIVDGTGTETIDGDLTQEILYQWTSITMVSNGTSWFIL